MDVLAGLRPPAHFTMPADAPRFTEIVARERSRLGHFIRGQVRDAADAEDILQDAQLTLLYKWDKVRSPESWLIGTVKKKCIMYWRKRRGSLCEAVDTANQELSVPGG